jgi:4-amino-4-deoxy-L-arabinose transferase-like glycosyltransferase
MQFRWLLLLLIASLIIGGTVRLWRIGQVPMGYTWDEAAITYDAWAIAQTGKDHHGNLLPLTFTSLGDYKAPVMIYLLAGIFMVSGVHTITVRILSALAGWGLIFAVYLLARELFPKKPWIGGAATALTALSSWGIFMSRVGYEANVAIFGLTFAVWLGLKARRSPRLLIVSVFTYLATFYTYQSARLVVPLLFGLMIWYGYQAYKKQRLWLILAMGILMLGCLPYMASYRGGGGERARQALIIYQESRLSVNRQVLGKIAQNTLAHFSPNFLVQGQQENLRQSVPGFGILYILDLPGLIIGIWSLVRHRRRTAGLLLGWAGIALLPSILGAPSPHTLRSAAALPALMLITAYGLVVGGEWLIKLFPRRGWNLILGIFVGIYILSAGAFEKVYYTRYASLSARDFQYGYAQAVGIARAYAPTVDKIYFTDAYGSPYIFTLLFSGISPREFLAGGLANYQFGTIKWPNSEKNSLFVGTPLEIPLTDDRVLRTIPYPDGNDEAFVIAKMP